MSKVKIYSANSSLAFTLLRITIGLLLLAHGIPKLANLAGFYGWLGQMFPAGISQLFATIAILVEVGGGLALVVGYQPRLAALSSAALMFGIAFLVHHNNIIEIFNFDGGDGQAMFEYPFLIGMASLALSFLPSKD